MMENQGIPTWQDHPSYEKERKIKLKNRRTAIKKERRKKMECYAMTCYVDLWLLTVMRGTPEGRDRTRWISVSALWTEVVLRRLATALANPPTAMNTIFLGIPPMSFRLPAHSISRPTYSQSRPWVLNKTDIMLDFWVQSFSFSFQLLFSLLEGEFH